jgi:hypothetical protein
MVSCGKDTTTYVTNEVPTKSESSKPKELETQDLLCNSNRVVTLYDNSDFVHHYNNAKGKLLKRNKDKYYVLFNKSLITYTCKQVSRL